MDKLKTDLNGVKYAICNLHYTDMLHGQTCYLGFPGNLAINQLYVHVPDPLWPKYFKRHCPVSTSQSLAERSARNEML